MSSRLAGVVPAAMRPRRVRWQAQGPTRSSLTRLAVTILVAWLLVLLGASSVVLVLHQRNGLIVSEARLAEAGNGQVAQLMLSAETGVRGYLLTGEKVFLQPYEQARGPLQEALDRLDRVAADDPRVTARLQAQREAVTAWWTQFAEPMAAGGPAAATPARQEAARDAFARFRTANTGLANGLVLHTGTAVERQRVATGFGLLAIVVIAVVGAAGAIRPTIAAVRQIGRPLEDLEHTVQALRAGDLDARADPRHASAEIRSVAEALNDFVAGTQEARGRLAEEVRLSQLVVNLGLALTTTLDVDDVAAVSVEHVSAGLESTAWMRAFDVELVPHRGRAAFPVELDPAPPAAVVDVAHRVNVACWQRQTCALVTRQHPMIPTLISADEGNATLDYVQASGGSAVLFVPIGAGQEALGYLALARTDEQPTWSDLEQRAALQIGREVGRAVMLARLFVRDQVLIGKLGALDVRRNDFVTMASHALRTPLSSIAGHLEIMRTGDLGEYDPELEGSMMAIERNAHRLNRLADDFLLLSRLEDGTAEHRPEVVDLQTVCRAAIEEEAERASAGDLSVVLTVHGRVAAYGVPGELRRAVVSLLSNALKFSPLGSTIKVAVYDDTAAGTATIEVSDTGLGISAADQQQLFTRFFRSDDAIRAEIPGTGLGLRLAKLVVTKHEGSIVVESDPDLGTTFAIVLPRADPPRRADVLERHDEHDDVYADSGFADLRTKEDAVA